jgi:hypothetical protein
MTSNLAVINSLCQSTVEACGALIATACERYQFQRLSEIDA